MNRILRTTLLSGAVALTLLSSCKKSADNPLDTSTPSSTSALSVTINDGWGALAAVTSVSYTTVAGITFPLNVNTAVAAFRSSAGSTTFIDGGTVMLNSKTLTKQSGNAYVYQNLTDPISFPPVTWSVSGAGSIPAINYTDDKNMPAFTGYNSLPSSVSRSTDLTVSLSGMITDADSVYCQIAGSGNKSILKRVAGNASQVVFTAAELSALGTTTGGLIQVAPWNYKKEDISSKTFYFINETCYSKVGITIN